MKKTFFIVCVCLLCCGLVEAQQSKGAFDASAVPAPKPHYQPEYTFDVPVDASAWQSQPSGLQVSFASINKLYFRTEVPRWKKQWMFGKKPDGVASVSMRRFWYGRPTRYGRYVSR
jgi:hypothetical protein